MSERERLGIERENFQVEQERGTVQEMLQEHSSGSYPAGQKRCLGSPWWSFLSQSVYEHLFELTARRGKARVYSTPCGHTDQLACKAWLLGFPGREQPLHTPTNTPYTTSFPLHPLHRPPPFS